MSEEEINAAETKRAEQSRSREQTRACNDQTAAQISTADPVPVKSSLPPCPPSIQTLLSSPHPGPSLLPQLASISTLTWSSRPDRQTNQGEAPELQGQAAPHSSLLLLTTSRLLCLLPIPAPSLCPARSSSLLFFSSSSSSSSLPPSASASASAPSSSSSQSSFPRGIDSPLALRLEKVYGAEAVEDRRWLFLLFAAQDSPQRWPKASLLVPRSAAVPPPADAVPRGRPAGSL